MTEEKRPIPDLCGDKSRCCGCTACYAICPVQAIAMEPDEKGFEYPIIDKDKCIRCYRCLNVCAFKKSGKV